MNRIRSQFRRVRGPVIPVLLVLIMLSGPSCEDLLNPPGGDVPGRLAGLWLVDEKFTSRKSSLEVYYVEIRTHPTDSTRILMANFHNVDSRSDAEAILSGRKLALPRQILEGGYTVAGTADISDDWGRMDWTYSVDDGSGIPDHFTAIYTRVD